MSDHGHAVEDDVDIEEFSEEATGIMPPLPLASWFEKTETSKHTEMFCGKFFLETLQFGSPRRRVFILRLLGLEA